MKKYQMASTMRSMSKPLPPSRTAPQFVVRFPDEEMRDRIKSMADEAGRSMNAQIVHMIQDYFREIDRETWESNPERLQQAFDEAEAEIFGVSVNQLQAQKRVQDQIKTQLLYLRNHIVATSQRLLSLQTMRQAMLTERAIKRMPQDDSALTEVDERIRSTATDLNESQAMLEALLPLDPDAQPARAASKPKQRPDAALLLPKIMSKETEELLEQIRRKQIADLLAKK